MLLKVRAQQEAIVMATEVTSVKAMHWSAFLMVPIRAAVDGQRFHPLQSNQS